MRFTDEQPFLDAIFARYTDDGPRLIYAEFLDDAGDHDRAEFVRVQVALARLPDHHPRKAELVEREAELRTAHETRWSEPLSDLGVICEFRRGVLDSVVVDAATFLKQGDEIFGRADIRRVRLRDSALVLEELLTSPLVARVRELDLWDNGLGNAGVGFINKSAQLKNLEALELGFNGIDDAGVGLLAKATNLPRVTSLSLGFNAGISSAGVSELATSPFFGNLTSLDLNANDFDHQGLQSIIDSKFLTNIYTLKLSENRIGDAGVAALANSRLLERILTRSGRLELRVNQIGPTGARELARSAFLGRCHTLDLTGNAIADTGLAEIVRTPALPSLRVLKVAKNQITDQIVTLLQDEWPRLLGRFRVLDLSDNRLRNFGVGFLERAKGPSDIKLDLSDNQQSHVSNQPEPSPSDLADDAAELRRRVSHPSQSGRRLPGAD
jgi:uncharacterized protein (TIGR02996 family)